MRTIKLSQGVSIDAVLLVFIKLVTMLLGLVVTRLLSEYLSVYEYGTYSQVLLVISTISTFTILGMMDGVNYFYYREKDVQKRDRYISTIFALQCVVSTAAGAIVLLLTKPLCAYFDNPDVADLLVFAAILPLMQNLLGMLQVLLVSVGKARILAVRNLLVSLARLAVVMLVVWTVHNLAVIFSITLALDIIQIVLFGVVLRNSGCFIRLQKADVHLFGQIFSYCAPMAVFTMVSALNRDLDKYLITWMTDTETLAVYTNASKKLPFDLIVSSFTTVLIPQMTQRVSQKNFTGAANLYRSFLEVGYISTTILCVMALTVAPQLLQLLYSEKYMGGLSVFCIYILVDMLLFTNSSLILSVAGKTKTLMLLGIGALSCNGALNILLFRLLGFAGPAWATLLTTIGSGILLLCLGARELHTRLRGFFDRKYFFLFAIETIVVWLLFGSLGQRYLSSSVSSFLTIVVAGGGCGVCMLLLNGRRLIQAMKNINRITKEKSAGEE